MTGINPETWLQHGALGLLGIGMLFAALIFRQVLLKLLDARAQEQMALIEALQNNSAAMAGLQATIQAMSQVVIKCKGHDDVRSEEKGKGKDPCKS
jgi:hypothetical protein